jgi:hypothetical protein
MPGLTQVRGIILMGITVITRATVTAIGALELFSELGSVAHVGLALVRDRVVGRGPAGLVMEARQADLEVLVPVRVHLGAEVGQVGLVDLQAVREAGMVGRVVVEDTGKAEALKLKAKLGDAVR